MGGILLIDAEQPFADHAIDALRTRGLVVHHAPEGAQGLALASAERPDLIVLCAELPDVKGYTIGNKLKKDDEFKSIPLILTSSLATAETFASHRKLKVRADEYLHKPFEADTLLATIGTLIPLPAPPPAAPAWDANAGDALAGDFAAGDFAAADFADFDEPSGLHIDDDSDSILSLGPDSDLLLPDEFDFRDDPPPAIPGAPGGSPPPVPLDLEGADAFDADDLMRELEHTGVAAAPAGALDLTPAPLSMPDALDAEIEAELGLMGLDEELAAPDFGEEAYTGSAGLPELSLPDQLPLSEDSGAYDFGHASAAPAELSADGPAHFGEPGEDDLYALLGDGSLSGGEALAEEPPPPAHPALGEAHATLQMPAFDAALLRPAAPAPAQPWQPAPTLTQAAFQPPAMPGPASVPSALEPAPSVPAAHELQLVAQVQHENAELKARQVELESRLHAAEHALHTAHEQLQQKSSSSSSSARDVIGLKEQLRARDKELERMKDEIFEHEKRAVEVQEALDQARAEFMAHAQATADKEAENAALRARVSALGAQRDELERVIHERLAAAEAERAQLRELVNGLQQERHTLGGQLHEVQQRLQNESQLRQRARQAAEMALSLLSAQEEGVASDAG